jgi:hypothetical protein
MLYTIILNTKSECVEQEQYANIYDACKAVDSHNQSAQSDNRKYIVKISDEPLACFGNPQEWLDFLERCKFILEMKDYWDSDDFYNNQQLFNSIQAVKNYMYG